MESIVTPVLILEDCTSLTLSEDSRQYLGWKAPSGTVYQNVCVPPGCQQAPAYSRQITDVILERVKERVKAEYGNKGFILLVLIDDILCGTPLDPSGRDELHWRIIYHLLGVLEECGLKINLEKSEFGKSTVNYLGYQISANFIRKDACLKDKEDNIKVFSADHPPQDTSNFELVVRFCAVTSIDKLAEVYKDRYPETLKEIQSFLGSVNYIHSFKSNLASVLHPIYQMIHRKRMKANNKIEWSESAKVAFKNA